MNKLLNYLTIIKVGSRKFRLLLHRLDLCLGVLLSGYQLTIVEFLYSKWHNRARSKVLKSQGYIFRQILAEPLYKKLCNEPKLQLDKSINESIVHVNVNPWVLNKRHYADLSSGLLSIILDEIKLSPNFKEFIKESLGETDFEITAQAIWRNYSEDKKVLSNIPQEVNSTFFHVDNGGEIKDRLHLNFFLYLGDVALENGPFTFYDIKNFSRN